MNQPKMVLVECVWPASRGPKDDCRAGTGIVWKGHGDIQPYPADLWHKLAPHPDVWRQVSAEELEQRIAAAEAESKRLRDQAELARKLADDKAEADRLEAERHRQQQQSEGADGVIITKVNTDEAGATGGAETGTAAPSATSTAGAETGGTELVTSGGAVASGVTTAGSTGENAAAALQAGAADAHAPEQQLTAAELDGLPDEHVRKLADSRSYGLNPRLNAKNLRKYFLEAQAARAKKGA